MMTDKRSRIIFLLLLAVSVFLHGLAWTWLDVKEWFNAQQVDNNASRSVQITLRQPPAPTQPQPEPQPQLRPKQAPIEEEITEESAPEEHQPQHNADTFASSNNTEPSIKTIMPGKRPEAKVPKNQESIPNLLQAQPDNAKVSNTTKRDDFISDLSPLVNSKGDSKIKSIPAENIEEPLSITQNMSSATSLDGGSLSTEFEFQESNTHISDEMLAALGNMELLDDVNLSGIDVKDPFSEVESQRIKMVNRYLQRMEKQIKAGWEKPEKKNQAFSGVIKFSLTPYGQLTEAYIYLGSGDPALDQSALAAVKQVKRFAVPESALVAAKYYNSLRFQYSSHEYSGETIPLRGDIH